MGALGVPLRQEPRVMVFARAAERRRSAEAESLGEYRLRNALFLVVCSATWEEELYAYIKRRRPRPLDDPAKALYQAKIYPPGGYATAMLRCDYCRRFVPPQAVATPCLCPRCLDAWRLDDDVLDAAQRRRAHHVGRCTACRGRWPDGEDGWLAAQDHVLTAVRICAECDANRMTPGQIRNAPTAGATWHRKVSDAEAAAHFEGSGYRRSRRARFRYDDDRTDGGRVDYSVYEDGQLVPWHVPDSPDAADVGADGMSVIAGS